MMQTRSQAIAQTNAPAIQSTNPVTQKATTKIARIPIKAEKEKDSKTPPSRVDKQPPNSKVIVL